LNGVQTADELFAVRLLEGIHNGKKGCLAFCFQLLSSLKIAGFANSKLLTYFYFKLTKI